MLESWRQDLQIFANCNPLFYHKLYNFVKVVAIFPHGANWRLTFTLGYFFLLFDVVEISVTLPYFADQRDCILIVGEDMRVKSEHQIKCKYAAACMDFYVQ